MREGPWFHLTQVHGSRAVIVDETETAGVEADAVVTRRDDVTLAIATADCAPIAMTSADGVIAAVHAGWRGLVAGVISEAASSMRALGATKVSAALGPCIHPDCYEFSGPALSTVRDRWGDAVVKRTSAGKPAFDLSAAVSMECDAYGIALTYTAPICTSCDARYFSYRARPSDDRQVMLVWSGSR